MVNLFDSGNTEIDNYFREKALADTSSKTFIVVHKDEDNENLIGLYTLCCSGFIVKSSEKFYIYPAVEIKYFAINKEYQDIQYSADRDDGCLSGYILCLVIGKIMDFTDKYCGADKIILYSVPDAIDFYKHTGFRLFENFMLESNERYLEGCSPMYLDLNTC